MVRRVTAILLVLLLSLPISLSAGDRPDSVQALQSDGRTFCTAFSINEQTGYWATAAHCAQYVIDKQLDVTIMGEPAVIVAVFFPAADVAVFQSSAHAPAIKLAKDAVGVGGFLAIVGYPYGIARTRTEGTMGARLVPILHPSTGYYMVSDILDITTAGGNSGSPVLDKDGRLVGVLWGGFTESAHSLAVPFESVSRVLQGYAKS